MLLLEQKSPSKCVKKHLIGVVAFFLIGICQAQTPLGTWQTHFSYHALNGLTVVGSNVYAASKNGLFYVNTSENQAVVVSQKDGLSETGVTSMAFSATAQTLVLGYENGNVDLLKIDS